MNEDLISIIIPVYNVDKYLSNCLNSVLSQDYLNIEIILINDGSTDNSENICLEYSKKDNRIRYFKNDNHGVSYTRNYGIKKCNGKYICFVDSDDYIEKDMISTLYANLINGHELSVLEYREGIKTKKTMDKNTTLLSYISDNEIMGYIWNKMYLSSIIKENNILFDENIYVCEDFLFNIEYLKYINSAYYDNKKGYNYVVRNDSCLNKKFDIKWVTNIDSYMKCLDIVKCNFNFELYNKFISFVFYKCLCCKMRLELNNCNDNHLIIINNYIENNKKVALNKKYLYSYKNYIYYYFYYLILFMKKILNKK